MRKLAKIGVLGHQLDVADGGDVDPATGRLLSIAELQQVLRLARTRALAPDSATPPTPAPPADRPTRIPDVPHAEDRDDRDDLDGIRSAGTRTGTAPTSRATSRHQIGQVANTTPIRPRRRCG